MAKMHFWWTLKESWNQKQICVHLIVVIHSDVKTNRNVARDRVHWPMRDDSSCETIAFRVDCRVTITLDSICNSSWKHFESEALFLRSYSTEIWYSSNWYNEWLDFVPFNVMDVVPFNLIFRCGVFKACCNICRQVQVILKLFIALALAPI